MSLLYVLVDTMRCLIIHTTLKSQHEFQLELEGTGGHTPLF